MRRRAIRSGVPPVLVAALLLACGDRAADDPPDLAVTDVRVFDGEQAIERATVLVRDGIILAAGAGVEVPAGTGEVVDGRGLTLLPGLVDAHVHVRDGQALEQAAALGVTTALDMFTIESFAADMREEQREGGADDRADLLSAGTLATAPGGHGTQFGLPIPTLDEPEDAEPFVADRAEAGADYVKVVLEDGLPEVGQRPSLDAATVRAVVAAAHGRDLLVVAHVGERREARVAIEAGVDGLAHTAYDAPPGRAVVEQARRSDVFIVPTLVVHENVARDGPATNPVLDDGRLLRCVSVAGRARLAAEPGTLASLSLAVGQEGVRRFDAAGVPVLAGSDAANPGTAHGASLHRELQLLVDAGLTPVEALAAATSVPAEQFRLEDRGRIAEGRRADLVLVEGDPMEDVRATRDIVTVWKAGVPVDRERRCLGS